MLSRKIIAACSVTMVLWGSLHGQIFSPSASYSFNAVYNRVTSADKVYIYNRPVFQAEITASIIATSVDSTAGWTFQWSVFNWLTKTYNVLPGTSSGVSSAIDTISVSSGYQVEMIKGSVKDTFRIWLLMNDFNVEITNKDEENKLKFGYFNCSSLDLRADTSRVPIYYYDLVLGKNVLVNASYLIRWDTDNEEASSPSSRLITRVNNPPSSDTWYILSLTDTYGLKRKDSVFYESIQSTADLKASYVDLGDSVEYSGLNYGDYYNDGIKSAPGKYKFDLTGSKNLASFEIAFGDGDTLISEKTDTLTLVHEYQKPGIYAVVLTTRSEENCQDSATVEVELVFATGGEDGNFRLPNVFTPNADSRNDEFLPNRNDIFRSEDVSVLTIDITIFDRSGRKVHSYAGNIRDWEGWNGLIRNTNIQATEGVYFYVITTFSAHQDKINPIGSKVMKGYFHLYRE